MITICSKCKRSLLGYSEYLIKSQQELNFDPNNYCCLWIDLCSVLINDGNIINCKAQYKINKHNTIEIVNWKF